MQQKSLFPVLTPRREESKKHQLQQAILKKRTRLAALIAKSEMLRVELEMVQQEYNARVGKLILKDNQLDFEIIRYKNILRLMQDGLTYEEAVKEITETYYAEQLELDREQERLREEEAIYHKREILKSESLLQDLKKLWKKLITRFHPDLVLEPEEKKRREGIIKQINRAYEEQDIENLRKIEDEAHVESYQESTIEKLEELLVVVENEILEQTVVYRELKISEWFGWKLKLEKAKKRNSDIFADLERKLLDDIVKKYAVLNTLKAQLNV